MKSVYTSAIYNSFLKEMHKKNGYTTQQIADACYLSVGTINALENSDSVLKSPYTPSLLKFYNLPENYLTNLNQSLTIITEKFIESVIFINEKRSYQHLLELRQFLAPYNGTILHYIYDVCEFIYYIHNEINTNQLRESQLEYILNRVKYLSEEYQSFCNIYIGVLYCDFKEFNLGFNLLNKSISHYNSRKDFNALGHYFLSNYYANNHDVLNSIHHCDLAIKYFAETHNTRRLMNTNIIKGLQYLELRDYEKALQININSLENNPTDLEKRTFLNNIAYIYMLQEKFENALKCFENMPKEHMLDKHYLDYTIVLYETANLDKALKICTIGISISNDDQRKILFDIFLDYFNTRDSINFTKQLAKYIKKFYSQISNYDLQLYYGVLYRLYKKIGQYKKALEYLEKIHQMNIM